MSKVFGLVLAALATLLLNAFGSEAYWIISHHSLVSQRLDPILSGSGTSGHTHSFVGSAAILPGTNPNTSCTTSPVKADRSNYWQPALYYFNATSGNFTSIPLGFVNTYYLQRGGTVMGQNTSLIGQFPYGLRMIAGSAVLYDAPNSNAQAAAAINFVCLDYTKGTTFSSTLPNVTCPDGLRAQVVFPSCWNGVDLDSSDHQSHMSYPLGNNPDNGDCPSTHPHKLITLFYEYVWSTGSYVNSDQGALVLANGDTVGYSLHADFISGWDETVLRQAIDQCDGQLGGDLEGCPPFVASLKDEVAGTTDYCSTTAAVQEKVTGTDLQYLPGCQPIRNGKWVGVGKDCIPTTPNITTPTMLNQTSTTVVPSGFSNLGCYTENSGSRVLSQASYSRSSNTPGNCTAYCSAAGYRYAGVEYGSECYCGNYILNGGAAPLADSSSCNMLCSGNKYEACGGSARIQIYQNQTWTPSVWTVQSYKQWQFSDCVVDTLTPRTLATGISVGSKMTVESCLDACSAKNMTSCGMEYGGECYGSTVAKNFTSAPSVGNSDPQARGCSMPCAGNSSEACGGAARLNLYQLQTSVSSAAATATSSALSSANSTTKASTTSSATSTSVSSSSSTANTSSTTSTSVSSSSSTANNSVTSSASSLSSSSSLVSSTSSTASPVKNVVAGQSSSVTSSASATTSAQLVPSTSLNTTTSSSTTTSRASSTTTISATGTGTTTQTVTKTATITSATTVTVTTTKTGTTTVKAKRRQATTSSGVSSTVPKSLSTSTTSSTKTSSSSSSSSVATLTKYSATHTATQTVTVFTTLRRTLTTTQTKTALQTVRKNRRDSDRL